MRSNLLCVGGVKDGQRVECAGGIYTATDLSPDDDDARSLETTVYEKVALTDRNCSAPVEILVPVDEKISVIDRLVAGYRP